jgi:pentatricopeptide repeat protein
VSELADLSNLVSEFFLSVKSELYIADEQSSLLSPAYTSSLSTMLSSYVCRQCRARLTRRIVPARGPQWQPRATFLSFRKDKPHDNREATHADAQLQQDALREQGQDTTRIGHTRNTEQLRPQRGSGRYSRLVDDVAEDEYPPASGPRISYVDANEREPAMGPAMGPATLIARALEKKGNVDKAWALFEEHYTSRDCQAFRDPSQSDLKLLEGGKIFDDIVREVNGAFCFARIKPTITPTLVLFKYEQLGLATPEHWIRQTLAFLTHEAISAINAPPETSYLDLPSILFELVSVWRLLFQCKGENMQLESISKDWNLPVAESMPTNYDSADFNLRLQRYMPGLIGNSTLGFCAVYVYTISDALGANQSLHKEASPFIQVLERLLAGSYVTSLFRYMQNAKRFQSLPKTVQKDIMRDINTAPDKALKEIGAQGVTLKEDVTHSPAANLEAFHLKQIARAVESRQATGSLNHAWKEVNKAFKTDGKIAIPPRVYNAFLSGYLILNQSQGSVEVWNHMIAHGIKPDVQSWVALLEGCQKARDLEGFNTMWARMLSTGIEPDIYAWTARVHGLFHLRQIDLGLAALDDMGRRWLSAEAAISQPQSKFGKGTRTNNSPSSTKTINKHTKPTVEVINAAITALVQLKKGAMMRHEKRIDYIQKLLGWARNFDIKPDAITYNSLIKLYLRASDYSTAFKVLHQMEKDGIEADMATHTMLVNMAFDSGSFNELNAVQQTEKIIRLLNDIEAGGLKLNDYVYSTAIDRFLKQYSNHDAVRQIVEHMHQRNMTPSAHAYTSLITHYFQQNPPSIVAIDSLVHQFFTSHKTSTDGVLFDRIIEGYASHGEVGKMMSVLTRMSRIGTLPGWNTLIHVVEALVRNGDYDRARTIVRDIDRSQGLAEKGIIGNTSNEKRFYDVVRNLGIDFQDDRMGDYMRSGTAGSDEGDFGMNDRPIRASRNDKVLGEQLRAQEIQQMTQNEEAQESHLREPGRVSSSNEEDVHGFLTDDHEDIHSRIHR